MSARIKAQLEASRKELLNLDLRNPLINYRLRAQGLSIFQERAAELFRILVRQNKAMTFLPGKREASDPPEEFTDEELEARFTDLKIQTPYTDTEMQGRLLKTHRMAQAFLEEKGVNALFLVLGMLKWYEADASQEQHRAPLILIPVQLERASARDKFQVRYTGEEIGMNLSLAAKLKLEFGVEMPPWPDLEDLDVPTYFGAIEKAISGLPRWEVERDAMAIGFFSFTKFLMYRDLSEEAWGEGKSLYEHPTIKALFETGFRSFSSRLSEEDHLDRHIPPQALQQVVDADSSQTLAIWSVSQGHDLVIQGPPGGGKSQTITNLIADAIGKGKKVLFVAEKRAALEVVKRRLDKVGIGDACLELHGQDVNKKSLLTELRRTLDQGKPVVDSLEKEAALLSETKERLNGYCEAVNMGVGTSEITPYLAFGNLLAIQKKSQGEKLPTFSSVAFTSWSAIEYQRKLGVVEEMQARLASIGVMRQHTFRGSGVRVLLPSDWERLDEACVNAWQATARLCSNAKKLAEILGFSEPQIRTEVEILCRAARRALEAPTLEGVHLRTGDWQARSDDIRKLLQAGARYAELHTSYDGILIPEAWEQDLLETRQHLAHYGTKWWRFLASDFRKAKNRLFGLCQTTPPQSNEERIRLVDAVMEARRQLAVLRELQSLGASLFGAQWQGAASDWQVLQNLFTWIITLYHDIGDGQLPDGILTFLSGNTRIDGLQDQVAGVERVLQVHLQQVRSLATQLALDEDRRFGRGQTIENQPLAEQEQLFSQWTASLPELSSLIPYNLQAETFQKEGLQEVLAIIDNWPAASTHLSLAFARNWYEKLLEKALQERPALHNFDGMGHQQVLQRFRQLDEKVLQLTRSNLALSHWQHIPRHDAAGQLGVLKREMEKKSRHLPIRQLMRQAGNAVQALKPVFMMSPLSIANYLPPNSITFDLVIFDEASQVKPVDALGAILRGKQLVVVGDSKQMPPTNFFESMMQDEEGEEDSLTQDMESILGFCVAQGMSQQLLRWHYRSRHESLIAVSNYEFYDNRLIIFPSPDHERSEVGLQFRHLPYAVYQRGKGQTNPDEAAAIAQAVMTFARQQLSLPPAQRQTLLVAAFSMAQKRAIEDRLEILRRQDSSCESFFAATLHEPFDVKNLETVQGDERDVVFISIGYGRDENGYLTMNFGPLNRDGGERRLNVLISRARRRCEVFTNLTEEDIDLSKTNSRGVKALKSFLAYARTGNLAIPQETGRGTDSPFEEQVKAAAEGQGYEVSTQVGSSGFFIDLAIIDPRKRGRYLLGIECDGVTYHSSRSARDRDRLRQQVLENLGWRIHRIWSTDWFRHPDREMRRLLAAIEEAKTYAPVASPTIKEDVEVQRIQIESTTNGNNGSVPYQVWDKRIDFQGMELHAVPSNALARLIVEIVVVESPVHISEVARRLARAAGISQVGKRIRAAVETAYRQASIAGAIRQQGEFLWVKEPRPPVVRDRSALPATSRKLELITTAEIAQAVMQVVKSSLGIDREEVPAAVLRLFGFARVNEEQKICVDLEIERMISNGQLKQTGSQLVVG